tara:strand:- start:1279 stop:2127 length:849 start_codon:yes stop_codon:yes gene_type:complete
MQEYSNLNEAFAKELEELKTSGKEVKSRGFTQVERLFVSFKIKDPAVLEINVPARKFNSDYAILEWLWYLQADSNVRNIGKLADIWNTIADENNEVESNYGFYLQDQWAWLIKELLCDSDTRRATAVINQPYHKSKNPKDYPCTQYIHFFIRDNLLHLGVSMRSNDAVFGFCNDVFTFSLFQQLMLNELNARGANLKLGFYHHHAGSFHVYDRHYPMMNKITNNYCLRFKHRPYPTNLQKFVLNPELTFSKAASLGNFLQNNLSVSEIKRELQVSKRRLFCE